MTKFQIVYICCCDTYMRTNKNNSILWIEMPTLGWAPVNEGPSSLGIVAFGNHFYAMYIRRNQIIPKKSLKTSGVLGNFSIIF